MLGQQTDIFLDKSNIYMLNNRFERICSRMVPLYFQSSRRSDKIVAFILLRPFMSAQRLWTVHAGKENQSAVARWWRNNGATVARQWRTGGTTNGKS